MQQNRIAAQDRRSLGPVVELEFRDPVSFARDLARLAAHYDDESARLRAEAVEAREVAAECRRWAEDVRQRVAQA